MRRLFCLATLVALVMLALAPAAGAQESALGDSSAEAYDRAEYERSEINPNGPCFDPQTAPDVTGVPVEDLPLAYVNRNDPAGTRTVSPLDSDNNGIACDALTQEEAAGISAGEAGRDQPAASAQEGVSCGDFASAAGNPSQFQAQQFFDFEATPAQRAALDADGDGFACDDLGTGVDDLGETDADRAAAQPTKQPVVGADDGICVGPGEGDPDCAERALEAARELVVADQQYAAGAAQYEQYAAPETGTTTLLPETGGPSLLLPVAALLVGCALVRLVVVSRRNS